MKTLGMDENFPNKIPFVNCYKYSRIINSQMFEVVFLCSRNTILELIE